MGARPDFPEAHLRLGKSSPNLTIAMKRSPTGSRCWPRRRMRDCRTTRTSSRLM
jgi:hypothetical protein